MNLWKKQNRDIKSILKGMKIIFFIISILLGFAISMQFRTIVEANSKKDSTIYKIDKMRKQLIEEKSIRMELEKLVTSNESKKDEYLKLSSGGTSYKDLEKRWEETALIAGLTDVNGAGIMIILTDSQKRTGNLNLSVIHNSDIVEILNELKKAGAQAISINNERIVATSEQICAGPTILVNEKRCSAPFEIKAIGNSIALYNQLNNSNIVRGLRQAEIKIQISKSNNIFIPKYTGPFQNNKSEVGN